MAKKSELEAAYHHCGDLSHRAARAAADHDYPQTLSLATSCLPQLRDALNYQRRFLRPTRLALPPAELILRYAPLLFARKPLAALADWAAGLGRAEREAVPDLPDRLAAARQSLAEAVQLWSALDRPGPLARRAGASAFLKVWHAAGLVTATPAGGDVKYRRTTDLSRHVGCKCPECGHSHEATTVAALDPQACPGCGRTAVFVMTYRIG